MTQQVGPSDTGIDAAEGGDAAPAECLICNYDLAGLPAIGNCPECGLPVHRSLARQPFPAGADNFIRGQMRAMRDLASAIAILAFSAVAAVALLVLLSGWMWGVVFLLGAALSVLLWARGWHRVITNDPDAAWDMHHRATKRLIRWVALPGLIGTLSLCVMTGLSGARMQSAWVDAIVMAIAIGSMAAIGTQLLFGSRYLAAMARRVQNRSLSRSLLRQGYAIIGLGLVCVLLGRAPWWLFMPWAWFAVGLADSIRRLGLAIGQSVSDAPEASAAHNQ
jgi:hypothetical protein